MVHSLLHDGRRARHSPPNPDRLRRNRQDVPGHPGCRRPAARVADGVRFVHLAPIGDLTMVPAALAGALGLTEIAKSPVLDSVRTFLHDRRMLLLLDNFKNLIPRRLLHRESVWRMRRAWLFWSPAGRACACPASSVPGAAVGFPLHGPAPIIGGPLEGHWGSPVSAAGAGRGSRFYSDTGERCGRGRICCRLDGIPLAIELAAARVKALPVNEIAARLDHSLHLLTGGAGQPHPPSNWKLPSTGVRAAFRAGTDPLHPPGGLQGRLFARRRRDSVRRCRNWPDRCVDCLRRGDVLDHLANLIDKSLVIREHGEDRGGGATGGWRLSDIRSERLFGRRGEDHPRRHLTYFSAWQKKPHRSCAAQVR